MITAATLLGLLGLSLTALATQPPTGYVLVETIQVPMDGSTVTSATTLQLGVDYLLRASGTAFIGGPDDGLGDAEYAYFGNPLEPRLDACGRSLGGTDLGMGINDPFITAQAKSPDWGAYQPSHEYTITFHGEGSPIGANYHDCVYTDNGSGHLTLEIFAPDGDGDGVADPADICAGSDDAIDTDGDGIPDGCDICLSGDDALDINGNGIPDACDNQPPVADAGADGNIEWGATGALDGSASTDPDGDALAYRWTQMSGPEAAIADPAAMQTTFDPTEIGTYSFQLTVTDTGDEADSDHVIVTVADTTAPDATAAITRRGASRVFTVSFGCAADASLTSATLNGHPISDGQTIIFVKAGAFWKLADGMNRLGTTTLELAASCTDEAGNTAWATATMEWPEPGSETRAAPPAPDLAPTTQSAESDDDDDDAVKRNDRGERRGGSDDADHDDDDDEGDEDDEDDDD